MNEVLIIDGDKELCVLMKKCVEQENLTAVVANGGGEGLRLLEENSGTCSLIILDIMMPNLDGFQVLQKIRQTSNVPVTGCPLHRAFGNFMPCRKAQAYVGTIIHY